MEFATYLGGKAGASGSSANDFAQPASSSKEKSYSAKARPCEYIDTN